MTKKGAFLRAKEAQNLKQLEARQILSAGARQRQALADILDVLDKELDLNRGTITLLAPDGEEIRIEATHNLSEEQSRRITYRIGEGGNLMPELSFGTHFFQDLVESDIFYAAIFPQREKVIFNKDKLLEMPNLLADFLPEEDKYKTVVKVCDVSQLQIMSDVVSQKVICFFAKDAGYLSK